MDKLVDIQKIIPVIKNAGKKITYNFRFKRVISVKGKSNYVTDLDKTIEQYVIEEVSKIYPKYPFISEESINTVSKWPTYWVLDPIDGTTNLIHGYPSVCISLALINNGEALLGIVYCPLTNELYFAEHENGAYMQKGLRCKKISVSECASIKNSMIGFGCPYNKKRVPQLFTILNSLLSQCDDIKRSGPASLDICYVACGILDAYVELDLEIWDFLAGSLILKEAGGSVTDTKGNNVIVNKCDILASNSKIHMQMLEAMNK